MPTIQYVLNQEADFDVMLSFGNFGRSWLREPSAAVSLADRNHAMAENLGQNVDHSRVSDVD